MSCYTMVNLHCVREIPAMLRLREEETDDHPPGNVARSTLACARGHHRPRRAVPGHGRAHPRRAGLRATEGQGDERCAPLVPRGLAGDEWLGGQWASSARCTQTCEHPANPGADADADICTALDANIRADAHADSPTRSFHYPGPGNILRGDQPPGLPDSLERVRTFFAAQASATQRGRCLEEVHPL